MRAWIALALVLAAGVGCAGKSRPFNDDPSAGGSAGEQGGSSGDSGGSSGSTTGGSAGAALGGSSGSTTGGSAGTALGGDAGTTTGGDAGTSAGGSAGTTTGGSSSGGAAGVAGGDCNDERRALRDFVNDHKTCDETTDCMMWSVGCGVSEDGCTGAVYTNRDASPAEFMPLREQFDECLRTYEDTLGCATCDRIPTPPTCREGLCVGNTACALQTEALWDFKSRNDACQVDDDCVTEYIGCDVTEDDCTGAVYFSKGVDREELALLRADYYACAGTCGMCRRAASPPACVSGHCVIRPTR